MKTHRASCLFGLLCLISNPAATHARLGQTGSPRHVDLTLTEGTSMAAALSPDGRTLAIDLLGCLWVLP